MSMTFTLAATSTSSISSPGNRLYIILKEKECLLLLPPPPPYFIILSISILRPRRDATAALDFKTIEASTISQDKFDHTNYRAGNIIP
jgi:hypothetical protein